jgi:hypothetical protein
MPRMDERSRNEQILAPTAATSYLSIPLLSTSLDESLYFSFSLRTFFADRMLDKIYGRVQS